MAKIADFGLSRGEEVYVKKTMVSVAIMLYNVTAVVTFVSFYCLQRAPAVQEMCLCYNSKYSSCV